MARLITPAGSRKQLTLDKNLSAWLHHDVITEIDCGSETISHWADDMVPRLGALERDTVSANFLARLVRGAMQMGASRPRLLAAIHMTDAALRNPIGRVSGAAMVNLFAALEREFGDPAIALKLAAAARPATFSDFGLSALLAPTVGDMMADTVALQGFRQNVWQTRFDRETSPARIIWELPAHAGQFDACMEFSAASYAHLYRNSLPASLSPATVRFRHRPRFPAEQYAALLNCPVYFSQDVTCVEFDRAQLSLPSPKANPGLQREIMMRFTKATAWLADGRKHAAFSYLYLTSELNKSPLKLERLAASFGMSERTLRRKLVDEGQPFRDLLELVRRDMCDLYRIEAQRSMSEVAELLGYAELSAFTRAYKRWYGQPPSQHMTV
jgi:AraC-like DNA-binding protein